MSLVQDVTDDPVHSTPLVAVAVACFWGLPMLYASKLVMEMAQLCKAWKR